MKKAILVLSMTLLSLGAFPQKGKFGMGAILGNPTAFSVKYWTGEKTAVDASLGYYFGSADHLYLNADFLAHLWSIQKEDDLIRVYFGAGGGLGFISDLNISLRLPAGAALYLQDIPLELFAEIVPTLQIIGEGGTRFRIGGYFGARWYF